MFHVACDLLAVRSVAKLEIISNYFRVFFVHDLIKFANIEM